MNEDISISPAIKEATEKGFQSDPIAKKIDEIERAISDKRTELNLVITEKESELNVLKSKLDFVIRERPPVKIPWRFSVEWCLHIDAHNARYFLKTTAGVYKCVAFKNKVIVTPDIKNKVAVTLASMFKEKKIGRIFHNGTYCYGEKDFFKDSLTELTELKDEHKNKLERLIL